MQFTTEVRESIATHVSTLGDRLALFVGDPGVTGANELSYAGYSRQVIPWTPGASDGDVPGGQCTFEVPENTPITHIGVFTSAGVFRYGKALTTPLEFSGTLTLKITPTLKGPTG